MIDTLPISLCMIVKNEEKHLKECLGSVKDWVAEMIVVDTGSTDNTVKIAEEMGANVFFYEWNNHFAQARNFSISKASFPWILQLDADEEILPESKKWFFTHYPWRGVKGYACTIKNLTHIEFDEVQLSHLMVRFFKNESNIFFVNRIHEHVDIPIGKVAASAVNILHKGYGDPSSKETRTDRNRTLLEADYEKNPDNPDTLGYLAQHYGMLKNYEKAAEYGFKALESGVKKELLIQVCLRVCFLHAVKSKDEAFFNKVADYTDYSFFPEMKFYKGHLLKTIGENKKATKAYYEFLENVYALSEQERELKIINSILSITHFQIALELIENKNITDAIAQLEKGIKQSSTFFQGRAMLGKLYYETGRFQEAHDTFIQLAKLIKKLGSKDFINNTVPRYLNLAKKIKLQMEFAD